MKFLRDLITKLFGEPKVVFEDATVKYERVLHWTDKLYKEQLEHTLVEAKKRLAVLEETSDSLSIVIAELRKVTPKNQRIDVLTKVTNKKHQLLAELNKIEKSLKTVRDIQELHECYEFKGILETHLDAIQTVREEVSEVLSKYIPAEYVVVAKIIDTLNKTHVHLEDIFSRKENSSYIKAINTAEKLKDRREKKEFFSKKIEIIESEIAIEEREIGGLNAKRDKITKDPKYTLEKKSMQDHSGRYNVSFYDLQLKEIQSKVGAHQKRIKSLEEHLEQLQHRKKGLNISAIRTSLLRRIKEDHGIELELVE